MEWKNTKHVWKIQNPTARGADGSTKQITAAEAALNWQAENASKQNQVLQQISQKQKELSEQISSKFSLLQRLITEVKTKIAVLESELYEIVTSVKDFKRASHLISQKEAERKSLAAQLASLEAAQQKQAQDSQRERVRSS